MNFTDDTSMLGRLLLAAIIFAGVAFVLNCVLIFWGLYYDL